MTHSFKRAVVKTSTVKKQISNSAQDENQNSSLQDDGYGFHQWCNFGNKHKSETVYDIANQGDFSYLKWLLKPMKSDQKFKISKSMLPHINAALRIKDTPDDKWQMDWIDLGNGQFKLQYKTEQGICAPSIDYRLCTGCGKKKISNMFDENNSRCSTCSKN